MNRYNGQMPNSYTAVIGGAYPSGRRSQKIPPATMNIGEPPRNYQPSTERDRIELLFGSSFNFIDTTISAARVVGIAEKCVD